MHGEDTFDLMVGAIGADGLSLVALAGVSVGAHGWKTDPALGEAE